MDARTRALACLMALLGLLGTSTLAAQDQPAAKLGKRYGSTYEAILYPQKTPQEALQSLMKALDGRRIEYLLAHLADPKFVDSRVSEYAAFLKGNEEARVIVAFERLTRETALHFQEDPQLVKELRQFVKDADWEVQDGVATGTLKSGSPRKVFLRQLEDRWFLENRQQ